MERMGVREMTSSISAELRECINDCQECHSICTETITHCLQRGGRHAEAGHIRTIQDCAEICATSAHFMLRQSPLHRQTCAVCTQACTQCAESCEAFPEDKMMQQCAQICRRTAESTDKMARGG